MLSKNQHYTLRSFGGTSFLLPFGQGVVTHSPAFELNDSGLFIWNTLDHAESTDALFDAFAAKEQIPSEDLPEARADFDAYLDELIRRRLLFTNAASTPTPTAQNTSDACSSCELTPASAQPFYGILNIADLNIELHGSADCFSEELTPFLTDAMAAKPPIDQVITVIAQDPSDDDLPPARELLGNGELTVLEEEHHWQLRYPSSTYLRAARFTKDGTNGVIYIRKSTQSDLAENPPTENSADKPDAAKNLLQYEVFHALRLPFLTLARSRGYYMMHSASIRYRGHAWLISAPSGTGKSTHANLWIKEGWADMINGDLNLIGPANGTDSPDGTDTPDETNRTKRSVYGIPWCGTSGISTTDTVPLGGIILLYRGSANKLQTLTQDQKQLRTMQRLITPIWTEPLLDDCLQFTGALVQRTPVWALHCRAESEAAFVMKEAIDQYLTENP